MHLLTTEFDHPEVTVWLTGHQFQDLTNLLVQQLHADLRDLSNRGCHITMNAVRLKVIPTLES